MKKLTFLLILPVLLFFTGIYWYKLNSQPVSRESNFKDFLITRGSSASQIGNKLQKEGLIKNGITFKLYVQITGNAGKIQSGEYRLSADYSLKKIVDELLRGPLGVWVTIPEGLRREEIAYRFVTTLDKEDKNVFIEEFLQASVNQEGYLFPDTYIFLKNAQASAIVQKMRATFDKKVGSEILDDISSGGKSINQILTVASLVERETKGAEEKPIVAGIIYKRLKAGWPLQIDATLQYAVGGLKCKETQVQCDWWSPLTKEDLGTNSLYNSYKFIGFPPSPIANPGLLSIKAATYPQESDFWFYLHDTGENIHYARTIQEHNDNVRKYLK